MALELNGSKFNEFVRLETYPMLWPFPLSKARLARNGFYYNSNQLKCVTCDSKLDTSATEEVHAPNCAFGTDTRNVPMDRIRNYKKEEHRLASFLEVSWDAPISPADLSKFGFYFLKAEDTVRCLFCRLEVSGWEAGDTAEGEHKRWNPNCVFIRGLECGNLVIGAPEPDKSLTIVKFPPRHPQYSTRGERLKSFAVWPRCMTQTPEMLAEAGFYYTSRGDRVVCYQCSGGLRDWGSGDDPWVEHAVHFPHCQYVQLMKGDRFIERVAKAKIEAKREEDPVQLAQLVEDLEVVVEDTWKCKICIDKDLKLVLLPCQHLCTCLDCGTQLDNCPICRSHIKGYVKIFLA